MTTKPIIITGASGNLGSKVAERLIEEHQHVIVTGRNEETLSNYKEKATLLPGDLEDPSFLKELLSKASAVFLVLPSLKRLTLKEFAHQFITIAEANGVSHVVNISNSTLTRWNKLTSLIEFEGYLDKANSLHIKHLRCANFFENLNWGINTPYNPDIKLPYISSYEIAKVAANYLTKRNFDGHTVDELMGTQDYSMSDIATMLGVTYQQVQARPEDQSFFDAFNTGQYTLVQRTAVNTSTSQEEHFTLSYFLKHHFNHTLLAS